MLFQGFFEHLFAVSGAFWPFEHLYAVSGAFWTASCCFSHGHFFLFFVFCFRCPEDSDMWRGGWRVLVGCHFPRWRLQVSHTGAGRGWKGSPHLSRNYHSNLQKWRSGWSHGLLLLISVFFLLFVCSVLFFIVGFGFLFSLFLLVKGAPGEGGGGILRTTVFLFVIQWFTHCKMHFISLVILSLFNTLCPACGWGDGGGGLLHHPITSIVGFSCFTLRKEVLKFSFNKTTSCFSSCFWRGQFFWNLPQSVWLCKARS